MDALNHSFCSILLALCFVLGSSRGPVLEIPKRKACPGTNNGLSYSSSYTRHFHSIRRRFKGCTHVNGNLEITHLVADNFSYNMSFLNDIRYVSGYVLIALNWKIDRILLPSLEIIRGNQTMHIGGKDCSLAVVLNYRAGLPNTGLQELQMPALREISKGTVFFSQNPSLCYVGTIDWTAITGRGSDSVIMANIENQPAFSANCGACSDSCVINGQSRCWGGGADHCQRLLPNICHPSCAHRCYGPGIEGCCHGNCAGGCWGPKDTECMMCKDFRLWDQCVGSCPQNYDRTNQICYK